MQARAPQKFTYYLYRAATDESYPLENVNLANLPGVMAYIHHEVVCAGGCPRKFGITRILRYKITSKATEAAFWACKNNPGECEYSVSPWSNKYSPQGVGHQFMRFVGFDRGKRAWTPGGLPSVGCASNEINATFYHHDYEGATYYSLPGRCSSMEWNKVTEECLTNEPGGECESADAVGRNGCTWHAEAIGEVRLDDLTGITNHGSFCKHGGREWVSDGDNIWHSWCAKYGKWGPGDGAGRGRLQNNKKPCFWNGRSDPLRNRQRVLRVRREFEKRYPEIVPVDMQPPVCGH